MIYSNLLIFLSAIFLFSITSAPAEPSVPLLEPLLQTAVIFAAYAYLARRIFRGAGTRSSAGYFRAEKKLSILAIVLYAGLLFFTDIKYYFTVFGFGDRLPRSGEHCRPGSVYRFFIDHVECRAKELRRCLWQTVPTQQFFGPQHKDQSADCPAVGRPPPLFYDLLAIAPFGGLKTFVYSTWGDLLFFGLFLLFVMIFFPPLVRRLWGCIKLPEGRLSDHLSDFCRRPEVCG